MNQDLASLEAFYKKKGHTDYRKRALKTNQEFKKALLKLKPALEQINQSVKKFDEKKRAVIKENADWIKAKTGIEITSDYFLDGLTDKELDLTLSEVLNLSKEEIIESLISYAVDRSKKNEEILKKKDPPIELKILKLIDAGLQYKEIEPIVNKTEVTIKRIVTKLKEKYGIAKRSDLIAHLKKEGLL